MRMLARWIGILGLFLAKKAKQLKDDHGKSAVKSRVFRVGA